MIILPLVVVNAFPDILPVTLMFPVPLISLLLRSRLPPSCGDVSPTTSVLTELPDAAVIRP